MKTPGHRAGDKPGTQGAGRWWGEKPNGETSERSMGETPDGIGDGEMNGDGCIDREHTTQRIKIAAGGGWP